ncbi:uncharacterized protein LOC125489790 [Plutella xylostella]|uniref:uncharacterized protein LOC125489790 n=1 Tax=Plutella xylostella TaxID=51655 RepID=UPI002032AE84|nr:uncharacterized protein LOC125489790 [Plutella xylostella]
MAIKCNGCENDIITQDFMKCFKCKKFYDLPCLNVTSTVFANFSSEYKEKWLCPGCSRPKGDNSLTPVRSTAPEASNNTTQPTSNVNMLRGSRLTASKSEKDNVDIKSLANEIRLMRKEIQDLTQKQKTEIPLLRKEVADLSTQLNAVSTTITERLGEFAKRISDQEREILHLKASLQQSQAIISAQDQYLLKNEIEIAGVPETENENIEHIAMVISKRIGVDLKNEDLDDVFRAGPRRVTSQNPAHPEKLPRTIVVKLVRQTKRRELIKAAKSRRNLTSEGVVNAPPHKLFINERLTKGNRILFREARLRARQNGFRYCWVKDGSILIRKVDKSTAITIRNLEDLDKYLPIPKALQSETS